ncbi:unnamed protein product [Vitrella brassicaformis CCMP3155]|uniref:Uncharacterized protein n=1 Tax=Vitrella brassicaformis (strain CCMP3155) TaxID=1169540 RepID=A0A0G4H823_VITBC|nr:unnamed protein product [Vitrella brassicaformis CCMP3155]|eukprot:CEM39852.1 unnamed protein product [Vitrella brassicaformis CCMP3155]
MLLTWRKSNLGSAQHCAGACTCACEAAGTSEHSATAAADVAALIRQHGPTKDSVVAFIHAAGAATDKIRLLAKLIEEDASLVTTAKLHWFCERPWLDIILFLLHSGAHATVNEVDGEGLTPLAKAAKNGATCETLRTLLVWGASAPLAGGMLKVNADLRYAYAMYLRVDLQQAIRSAVHSTFHSVAVTARLLETLDSPARPFPVSDAGVAYTIASFLLDLKAIHTHFPKGDALTRRIHTALLHAVCSTASTCGNKLAAAETQAPEQQCFAVKDLCGRRLCLREVVRQAVREELTVWGLSPLCEAFEWRRLGGVERAGEGERFVAFDGL